MRCRGGEVSPPWSFGAVRAPHTFEPSKEFCFCVFPSHPLRVPIRECSDRGNRSQVCVVVSLYNKTCNRKRTTVDTSGMAPPVLCTRVGLVSGALLNFGPLGGGLPVSRSRDSLCGAGGGRFPPPGLLGQCAPHTPSNLRRNSVSVYFA